MITQELNGWRSHFQLGERLIAKSDELLLVLGEALEEGVEDCLARVHRLQESTRKNTVWRSIRLVSHISTWNLPRFLNYLHFLRRELLDGWRDDFGVARNRSMKNVAHRV